MEIRVYKVNGDWHAEINKSGLVGCGYLCSGDYSEQEALARAIRENTPVETVGFEHDMDGYARTRLLNGLPD